MKRVKYWTTDEFTKEFNKLKENSFPKVFQTQIDKIGIIVEHWRVCHACELGFNISEYSGSFEEVFLKLAYWPLDRHACNGDYKLSNLILK